MRLNWTSRLARPLARFFSPAEIMPAARAAALLVGLSGYGFSMAVMVRAGLGLDPWDVFHQGLARHTGMTIGTASAAKHDLVRSLGCDTVVDYRTERFEEVLEPVDLVVDLVGGDTAVRSLERL